MFILSIWHYGFVSIAFFYSINFVSDSSSYFEEAVLGNVLLDQTLPVRTIIFKCYFKSILRFKLFGNLLILWIYRVIRYFIARINIELLLKK